MTIYDQRTYRCYSATQGLVSFSVRLKETDLFISAADDLSREALAAVSEVRSILEDYIVQRPEFKTSLSPIPADAGAHPVIREMLAAGEAANVGPMAAVAGAVSAYTAKALLLHSPEVIVENGGDLYMQTDRELVIGIFAGPSPLSEKIGLKIPPLSPPLSLCTSSGTVGPSFSYGCADAVTVRSPSAAIADAAATAIGNLISKASDIAHGLRAAQDIALVDGILIIKDDQIGAWGHIELVSLVDE